MLSDAGAVALLEGTIAVEIKLIGQGIVHAGRVGCGHGQGDHRIVFGHRSVAAQGGDRRGYIGDRHADGVSRCECAVFVRGCRGDREGPIVKVGMLYERGIALDYLDLAAIAPVDRPARDRILTGIRGGQVQPVRRGFRDRRFAAEGQARGHVVDGDVDAAFRHTAIIVADTHADGECATRLHKGVIDKRMLGNARAVTDLVGSGFEISLKVKIELISQGVVPAGRVGGVDRNGHRARLIHGLVGLVGDHAVDARGRVGNRQDRRGLAEFQLIGDRIDSLHADGDQVDAILTDSQTYQSVEGQCRFHPSIEGLSFDRARDLAEELISENPVAIDVPAEGRRTTGRYICSRRQLEVFPFDDRVGAQGIRNRRVQDDGRLDVLVRDPCRHSRHSHHLDISEVVVR